MNVNTKYVSIWYLIFIGLLISIMEASTSKDLLLTIKTSEEPKEVIVPMERLIEISRYSSRKKIVWRRLPNHITIHFIKPYIGSDELYEDIDHYPFHYFLAHSEYFLRSFSGNLHDPQYSLITSIFTRQYYLTEFTQLLRVASTCKYLLQQKNSKELFIQRTVYLRKLHFFHSVIEYVSKDRRSDIYCSFRRSIQQVITARTCPAADLYGIVIANHIGPFLFYEMKKNPRGKPLLIAPDYNCHFVCCSGHTDEIKQHYKSTHVQFINLTKMLPVQTCCKHIIISIVGVPFEILGKIIINILLILLSIIKYIMEAISDSLTFIFLSLQQSCCWIIILIIWAIIALVSAPDEGE